MSIPRQHLTGLGAGLLLLLALACRPPWAGAQNAESPEQFLEQIPEIPEFHVCFEATESESAENRMIGLSLVLNFTNERPEEVREALANGLDDMNGGVRAYTAILIQRHRLAEMYGDLVSSIQIDENGLDPMRYRGPFGKTFKGRGWRAFIIDTLGRMEGAPEETAGVIRSFLLPTSQPETIEAAASYAALHRDLEAIPSMMDLLLDVYEPPEDEEEEEGISESALKKKTDELRPRFKSNEAWKVSIITNLQTFAEHAAPAIPAVREYALLSYRPELVEAAAGFLASQGDQEAVEPLLFVLNNTNALTRTRGNTALALGQLGGAQVFAMLSSYAFERELEPAFRREIVRSLGFFDQPESHAILLRFLRMPDNPEFEDWPWLVGAAAEAAVRSNLPDVLAEFTRLANTYFKGERSRDLCAQMTLALYQYQGKTKMLIPLLRTLAENQSPFVHFAALEAAEHLGYKGESFLIECLLHQHASVRRQAAQTLGRLGSQRAVAELKRAEEDPYWLVREEASAALALINPPAQ